MCSVLRVLLRHDSGADPVFGGDTMKIVDSDLGAQSPFSNYCVRCDGVGSYRDWRKLRPPYVSCEDCQGTGMDAIPWSELFREGCR